MVSKRKQRTPEQKEARKALDRKYYEAKKAGKIIIPRPPKMSEEERKIRAAERQKVNRSKAREGKPDRRCRAVKLDEPKPVRPARKLPIGRKEKAEPKRMKDRPEDPLKVYRKLKPGLWVHTYPDADLDAKRAKYGIAI